MLRRQFVKGSAIVGAAAVTPTWVTATSGFFAAATERRVAQVLDCKRTMVQNVPVLRGFAGDHNDLVSPFVMLDEFGPLQIDPGTLGMDIKAHPHAGVAPTTYLLSGSGRHTDSLQNDLIYREGQFMVFSSGRGAIHEEVSSMEIRRDGGVVHGFQIWLNLPASEKFGTPITTLRDRTDFPVTETEDYRIKVLMGEAFGRTAPTETHSPAFYHHIHIAEGGGRAWPQRFRTRRGRPPRDRGASRTGGSAAGPVPPRGRPPAVPFSGWRGVHRSRRTAAG